MISLNRKQAVLILTAVSIAGQIAFCSPAVDGKGFWDQKKALANRPLQIQTSLIRLKKSDNLWNVLDDKEVKGLMQTAMGSDTKKYFDFTQLIEMPDLKGNDLYAAGGIRGLYTVCETFFNLNLMNKSLCVCILDDNTISIYGAKSQEELPEPVREYIKDLQSRIEKRPKIVFLQANTTAIALAKVKHSNPKKNLNTGVITGSYKRVDRDPRFYGAEFKVIRLGGDKINFCCQAFDGGHTGEASGVVPIKNNMAVFKQDLGDQMSYKLIIHFDGKFVHIAQEGEGFGGIGVCATGTYEKTDDHKPQIMQN